MKASVILSFVAAVSAGLLDKRECAGNNCARAVTGTRGGAAAVSSHEADCSAAQMTMVTPSAVTVTVTVTVDDDSSSTAAAKRAVSTMGSSSMMLPAYATACTDAAEYASVCSCWGITATTSTASAPTSTVTMTVTADSCDDL